MWLRLFRWELKVLNWNICFVNLHLNIFWIFFNWSHLTFTDNISTVSVSKFKIEFIFAIAKLYSYWYCGETFQSCFFGSSQTAPSNSIRHQPSCRLPSSSSQDDKTLYWHAGPGAIAIQLPECPIPPLCAFGCFQWQYLWWQNGNIFSTVSYFWRKKCKNLTKM